MMMAYDGIFSQVRQNTDFSESQASDTMTAVGDHEEHEMASTSEDKSVMTHTTFRIIQDLESAVTMLKEKSSTLEQEKQHQETEFRDHVISLERKYQV